MGPNSIDSNSPPVDDKEELQRKKWAAPIDRLSTKDIPNGARTININNREIVGPLQGFGPMWQRNYRVRLSGAKIKPEDVIQDWKENFAAFQYPGNHFSLPLSGVKPGEVVFIETNLPIAPGMPGILPMKSGGMILYSDDEMFTVMTPEGFPISGWNTFSAYEEDGTTVAQIQGLLRTSDPIYEFGFRFMGGEAEEDRAWFHVLKKLAERWNVNGQVQFYKVLIDPNIQWRYARNVWKNAAIRSFIYWLTTPIRGVAELMKPKART